MAKNSPKGAGLSWLHENMSYAGDECLRWPFRAKNAGGYGAITFRGRLTGPHREMCTLAHGEPPVGYWVAHSCGQRDCCNPRHLRWATPKENQADKRSHGTVNSGERNGNSKLTREAVLLIKRRLSCGELHRSIAQDFGVAREAISSIAQGKTWAHITEGHY